MVQKLVMLASVTLVATAGVLAYQDIEALVRPDSVVEERVNANLVRARVNGEWIEFPMIALSERLCKSSESIYRRYCD